MTTDFNIWRCKYFYFFYIPFYIHFLIKYLIRWLIRRVTRWRIILWLRPLEYCVNMRRSMTKIKLCMTDKLHSDWFINADLFIWLMLITFMWQSFVHSAQFCRIRKVSPLILGLIPKENLSAPGFGRNRASHESAAQEWEKQNEFRECTGNDRSYHHHVTPSARISLTLSRQPSILSITSGRSSELHPVSAQSFCMQVLAGRPVFARHVKESTVVYHLRSTSHILKCHLCCEVQVNLGKW